MKKLLALFVLAAVAAVNAVLAADVSGVITFKGTAPDEKELTPIKDDATCSASYPGALPKTKFYVVSPKGELADVIVVIKGVADAKSTGTAAAPVVMDQKGCLYSPQIIAVQTGQKVVVKNSDTCVHNVHTVPKQNESKNLVQMPGGADLEFTFDKPEPFLKFQCDVHPWMFAWVTVVDHPYFAVSGADGKFTIKNVPPGKYTIEATHRKLGTQTADLEVKDSGANQDFTFAPK
jgi:plastocyanin